MSTMAWTRSCVSLQAQHYAWVLTVDGGNEARVHDSRGKAHPGRVRQSARRGRQVPLPQVGQQAVQSAPWYIRGGSSLVGSLLPVCRGRGRCQGGKRATQRFPTDENTRLPPTRSAPPLSRLGFFPVGDSGSCIPPGTGVSQHPALRVLEGSASGEALGRM